LFGIWTGAESEVFRAALSNKDWRMKKLRGNEFGEMHTAVHNVLLCFLLSEI
jgi:hypothetical protein